jgi:hypothetical protein
VLSQRKYALDLLSKTRMLGCRVVSTSIKQNHKLYADTGDLVDKEQYQRLVGQLIYLCHTRPDIAHIVSVVNRYMHNPREQRIETIRRILRYINGSPEKKL